ncbi:MAG: carbohydrate ABC transporter permease, partial [Clostridia bacterium]|nr:carbohydrate ABC transporter permease [Clostridia bacterium]
PTYLQMRNLKLINTTWVMVLPGLISTYNMIITRTFIQSNIPQEMLEAAQIDGCSDFQYFFRMVLPLSKAVIAVITLYCAVGHWNAYFNAIIYLTERERYPLQIILREVLVANQVNLSEVENMDPEELAAKAQLANQLKYSLIIVSCGPILLAYPFVQKYFVKGVMIGSVKG